LNRFHRQKEEEKHKTAGRLKQIDSLSRHCTKQQFAGENRGRSMDETSDWKGLNPLERDVLPQKCDSANGFRGGQQHEKSSPSAVVT
jgi:hypothetical protein